MWRALPLWLFVSLVCLISINAQTVDETKSSIVLNETAFDLSLVVANPGGEYNSKIEIELLDEASKSRASASQNLTIRKGTKPYQIAIPLGDLTEKSDSELVWYRLHYRIGKIEGIVSVSELLKDDFELRVAASEDLSSGTSYRVRVRTLHPYTQQPVKEVKIEGELSLDIDTSSKDDELVFKLNSETDAEGFAVLDFVIPADVKLDYNSGLKVTGKKRGIVREINENVNKDETRNTVFLSPDKPLYQPGQNFSVRGLYFDANNNAIANAALEFSIKDEDGTVLYRENVKTSAYGIASVTWKIPEDVKLGIYRVEVSADEELRDSLIPFNVSRYDLPQFTVTATPDRSFYLPENKTAEITVKADYLFGKPVAHGKVRVVQESERHWNFKEQKYDIVEKQAFEGETDAEGKFVVKADLNSDWKDFKTSDWERFNDLNFTAYFTDSTTNRTEQKRFDVRLTKEPIHIYLVGRNNKQSINLPITAYVATFYADGTPAVCETEIRGKYEKESKEQTFAQLKTNSLGAGKVIFSLPRKEDSNDDDLQMKIIARDAKGQMGTFDEELDFDDDDSIKIETEKTIFKPGESVKINLLSTKKDALIYIDIVKGSTAIDSYFVRLQNGKGDLKIPYNANFKGELVISAYTDDDNGYYYDRGMQASRGIIFPIPQNLKLDAKFSNTEYRPNEEGKINFSVASSGGKAVESALGVVVLDKAIEERARTYLEFGSYLDNVYRLLGYGKGFGSVALRDLNDLNLSKSISPEFQLAAEIMLVSSYASPRIHHDRLDRNRPKSLYAEYFKKQLTPIENALKTQYAKNYEHPTDFSSLRNILSKNGIDFASLRDPWGQNYYVSFSINRTQDIVTLKTRGADKKIDTVDDFSVSSLSFEYFTPTGKILDQAVQDYHKRTGGYIRDLQTLSSELAKQNVDLNSIKDRWNRDYRITFEVSGRNYVIRYGSNGENGVYEPKKYDADDFNVWSSSVDYFVETEARINGILSQSVNIGKKPFPKDEAEFKNLLRDNNFDFDLIRDGYGAPVYLLRKVQTSYGNKIIIVDGKQQITPVTEDVVNFVIRSMGADGKNATPQFADDFDLTTFSSFITEASKDTGFSTVNTKSHFFSSAKGAIRGVVVDQNGAVIPNAAVIATRGGNGLITDPNKALTDTNAAATKDGEEIQTFNTTTNDSGEFLLENLPSGKYSLRINAPGFKSSIITSIEVRSQNLVEIDASLQAGEISQVVTVTTSSDVLQTATATVGTTITSTVVVRIKSIEQSSTPRVREYFPETLLWQPELITNKKGKAELKLKFADNITTWKLYTIASTKNGKIGVAEKEVKVFQPFFVDLEPPKFLTEGDEINLPVQIRNYTEKKQIVDVSMAQSNWFRFLNAANRRIEVAPNETQNAVFSFKANSQIVGGKQRVTATALKDTDAIEKPVTVRPNGQEIVKTDSKMTRGATSFDVNFPTVALPKTPKAEIKIYPNLFSHVAESVEGLLHRPYGCGEQTISSTYPNLMILKFIKEDNALHQKAQKYLQKGYERLLGYQVADGGFSYWGGKDSADVALTAYALRFLTDAEDFIEVDENVIEKAQNWLIKQQRAEGSWTKRYYWASSADESQTKIFTSYVARTLASLEIKDKAVLSKALAYLKGRNAEIDEPYALALYGLALLESGNREGAKEVAAKLEKMAIPEGDGSYWKLETNTPFYGWGTAGRIETTALVTQLLTKTKGDKDVISRGTIFLLKNKDRYGVWYSTQTTINVLNAFLATLAESNTNQPQTIQVLLNGESLQSYNVAPDKIEPIILDLTGKINPAANNRLEVKSSINSPIMSQIIQSHYVDWKDAEISNKTANQSRALRLDYKCDRVNAAIMQDVNCQVEAERIGFKGFGMLLAEIGIPPGADVSRESLQQAMEKDWSVSRYDILPDRIIVYMWAHAGGTRFNFKFRPRYGINAQTPASVVYDYYNPEAQATIEPLKFNVK